MFIFLGYFHKLFNKMLCHYKKNLIAPMTGEMNSIFLKCLFHQLMF